MWKLEVRTTGIKYFVRISDKISTKLIIIRTKRSIFQKTVCRRKYIFLGSLETKWMRVFNRFMLINTESTIIFRGWMKCEISIRKSCRD